MALPDSHHAALQMREARWLADPRLAWGTARLFASRRTPDGRIAGRLTPSGPSGEPLSEWLTAAAWGVHLVHPDAQTLGALVGPLSESVLASRKVHDPDGDGLLAVDDHTLTGLPFQPSFFAFGDFQTSADGLQPAVPTPLDRPDLTAFHISNCRAVARAFRALGQPEKAADFEALAETSTAAMTSKMWLKDERFFDSIRASDGSHANVLEVAGLYPFAFDLFPSNAGFGTAWAAFLDAGQLGGAWPAATASRKCPAYSQRGWPAADGQRLAPAMANGPTWPSANSLVLHGIAQTLRAERGLDEAQRPSASGLTNDHLWAAFISRTASQYRDQDPQLPYSGECYDGDTGAWLTPERDVFDSLYLDLLITDIIGLVPRDDDVLELDPLLPSGALAHFLLDGQRYRGHDVTIVWDSPDDADDFLGDGRSGLDVHLDGNLAASSASLGPLRVDLSTGKPDEPKPASTPRP
jgi:hypothetical protein